MAGSAHALRSENIDSEVAELRAQLAAKEEELRQSALMMREVNHRVANSLQLASSILRMQAHQEVDAHTRKQLEKAGLRIGSIQHVHDRLYRSGDMKTIEFSQYLRDLCNDLADSVMQEEAGRVSLEAECERMRLPTDFVSKLGLVVNEFVTNALKHGVAANGENTVIRVRSRRNGNMLIVEVADNGRGIASDFDITRIKGLGMRLVRFVAGSLGGEAGAKNGHGGAVFFVQLPLPEVTAED